MNVLLGSIFSMKLSIWSLGDSPPCTQANLLSLASDQEGNLGEAMLVLSQKSKSHRSHHPKSGTYIILRVKFPGVSLRVL